MNIIEVMIVVAIMAALAAVALPSYTGYRERQKLIQVRKDFSIIETRIEKYQANNGGNFPPDLAAISITRNDPWGNQYQYRSSGTGEGNGQVREYSGTPVNTDFDLYSMGPDGGSVKSLTETLSLDDIVRADDGDFIGRAEDY